VMIASAIITPNIVSSFLNALIRAAWSPATSSSL
jgi:hypothetical protein